MSTHAPRNRPICPCGIPAVRHRPSHTPKSWPICTCGARAENHRVKHVYKPKGEVCECGLAEKNHLTQGPSHKREYRIPFVGIDGEGIDRNPHKYVMLCAAASDGRRWALEDASGLKTTAILSWMLTTLDKCRVFSYGFGYDITCILRDLPDNLIYRLLRPGKRYDRGKLRPVHWRGYSINWLQGKLTIAKGKQRVVIWDILKFYQQTFVASLKDWKPEGYELVVANIERMKAKRNAFTKADMPEMRDYCQTECIQLARLAQNLISAHNLAGLTLKSYYGPGSTASVALGIMKVKDYMKDSPDAMKRAIACAYSGGRFEHSFMGVAKPIYTYDISSAYPYHTYFLPCLKHGKWSHVTRNVDKALRRCTTALVRYSYTGKHIDVWAPFAHRDAKGNICYPRTNSGWVWLPEYQCGRAFGKVLAYEAWVYHTECSCHPFRLIADYYRRRSELGKDARGKVLKLAVNSVYGKLAQSKGLNPPFQNWIWAGLITSGTRAQVLQAIQTAPSQADVLAIATDGIFSRVPLQLPSPRDTGTSDLPKPLGGWEETVYEDGMLLLKPGIYLPVKGESHMFEGEGDICFRCGHGKEGHVSVKARGVGRKSLTEQRKRIIKAWEYGKRTWTVRVDRFHGAKSSIGPNGRRPLFGQWSKMRIGVKFTCVNRRDDMGLLERHGMSHPYNPSLVTPEALIAHMHKDITYEQP